MLDYFTRKQGLHENLPLLKWTCCCCHGFHTERVNRVHLPGVHGELHREPILSRNRLQHGESSSPLTDKAHRVATRVHLFRTACFMCTLCWSPADSDSGSRLTPSSRTSCPSMSPTCQTGRKNLPRESRFERTGRFVARAQMNAATMKSVRSQ